MGSSGSFADRPDEKLFTIEKEAKIIPEKKNRKEVKKLRCFANLEGLPGAKDPKPIRNFTLKPEEKGAPKMSKASKKNKKSCRKNVDMTAVNQFLEEKRFEERVGGSFADRPDEKLFTIEKEAKIIPEK